MALGKTTRYYPGKKLPAHVINNCINTFVESEPNTEIIASILDISFRDIDEFIKCYKLCNASGEVFVKLQGSSTFNIKFTPHGTEIKINSSKNIDFANLFNNLETVPASIIDEESGNSVFVYSEFENNSFPAHTHYLTLESYKIDELRIYKNSKFEIFYNGKNHSCDEASQTHNRFNFLVGFLEGQGTEYSIIKSYDKFKMKSMK